MARMMGGFFLFLLPSFTSSFTSRLGFSPIPTAKPFPVPSPYPQSTIPETPPSVKETTVDDAETPSMLASFASRFGIQETPPDDAETPSMLASFASRFGTSSIPTATPFPVPTPYPQSTIPETPPSVKDDAETPSMLASFASRFGISSIPTATPPVPSPNPPTPIPSLDDAETPPSAVSPLVEDTVAKVEEGWAVPQIQDLNLGNLTGAGGQDGGQGAGRQVTGGGGSGAEGGSGANLGNLTGAGGQGGGRQVTGGGGSGAGGKRNEKKVSQTERKSGQGNGAQSPGSQSQAVTSGPSGPTPQETPRECPFPPPAAACPACPAACPAVVAMGFTPTELAFGLAWRYRRNLVSAYGKFNVLEVAVVYYTNTLKTVREILIIVVSVSNLLFWAFVARWFLRLAIGVYHFDQFLQRFFMRAPRQLGAPGMAVLHIEG